VAATSRVGGL
jgi:RNA-directed DNA polymerase